MKSQDLKRVKDILCGRWWCGVSIGSVVDWVLLSQLEIILVCEVIGFDVDRQEWREEDARGSRH